MAISVGMTYPARVSDMVPNDPGLELDPDLLENDGILFESGVNHAY